MIELYNADNTTYTRHGDAILAPSSCEITAELNGPWGLSLFHPLDQEGRWRSIVPGAVIRAASFNGSQLFRIRETGKTDAGVTAEADPIFMDARGDCFILSTHPTNATGQAALTALCANNAKYTGVSDIDTEATAYFERRNLIDAIAGASPSFLERWGGEILFDNFTIRINERVGADYGVRVLYGRNIAGINEVINTDDVITRIVPVAYNGYVLTGSTPWVDSPNINSYPTIKTAEIKYDHIKLAQDVTGEPNEGDSVYNTLAEVRTALTAAAEADFAAGVDAPAVSLSIDMILLQNAEQYKDFVDLETVSLGDTVHCQHSRLGITSDARVVALKYDSLREAVTAVTLSSTEKTIFKQFATAAQAVRKALREDGSVVAEQIAGFIDGATTQLRIQNTVAQHQDVRAILFEDLDSTSATFGALSIGTQGLEISRQRTADGRDWVWTTAITAEGVIASTLIAQETLAVAKHFFADSSGVHVTEEEYDATDGNNVLITGNGVDIRDGTTSLARFGSSARVGQENAAHVTIAPTSTSFYAGTNGLAARISNDTATTTTGILAEGYTGPLSSGNGYTFPLRYYPTEVSASKPISVSVTLGGAAAIVDLTNTTAQSCPGGTVQYRSTTNSVRFVASSAITEPGAQIEITGEYTDYAPHFIFGTGISSGKGGFVEGLGTQAAGTGSHAEGTLTFASGDFSHAAGENTVAIGKASATFGLRTTASGADSFAAGIDSTASHAGSIALGKALRTGRINQVVVGEYNTGNSLHVFEVGNGDEVHRVNGFYVDTTGSAGIQTALTVGEDITAGGALTAAGDIKGARLLPGTVAIPSGANLNGRVYCQVGQYKCGSGSAGTLTNCPTSNYFTMTVISHQAADPTASNGVTVYRHLVDSTGAEWVQRLTWSSGSILSSTAWRKIISEDTSGNIAITNDLTAGGKAYAGHVQLINEVSASYDSNTELTPARICAVLKARAADFVAGTNIVNFQTIDEVTRATLYVTYVNDATAASAFCASMWLASDGTYYRKPAGSDTWALYSSPLTENYSDNLATITPIDIYNLTNGTPSSANGGCWYYKKGTRVHIHMAVTGITANSSVALYTIPAGYRPRTTSIIAGSAVSGTSVCGGYISGSTGTIYGFTARSNGTVTIDFDFDAFS